MLLWYFNEATPEVKGNDKSKDSRVYVTPGVGRLRKGVGWIVNVSCPLRNRVFFFHNVVVLFVRLLYYYLPLVRWPWEPVKNKCLRTSSGAQSTQGTTEEIALWRLWPNWTRPCPHERPLDRKGDWATFAWKECFERRGRERGWKLLKNGNIAQGKGKGYTQEFLLRLCLLVFLLALWRT